MAAVPVNDVWVRKDGLGTGLVIAVIDGRVAVVDELEGLIAGTIEELEEDYEPPGEPWRTPADTTLWAAVTREGDLSWFRPVLSDMDRDLARASGIAAFVQCAVIPDLDTLEVLDPI